jgi:hypothetical protein
MFNFILGLILGGVFAFMMIFIKWLREEMPDM